MTGGIRRGSTPHVVIHANADLTGASQLRVSIKSRKATSTLTGDRLDVTDDGSGGTLIAIDLTQDETLAYQAGEILGLQVKAKVGESVVPVSDIARIPVKEAIDDEVL